MQIFNKHCGYVFAVFVAFVFAGAPYVPPASAAQPFDSIVPSFQEFRPNTAWNDPPFVKDKKKVCASFTYIFFRKCLGSSIP